MEERDRRRFLAAVAGAGGIVGSAGCLGGVIGDGSDGTTTEGSPPGTTAGTTPGTTAASTEAGGEATTASTTEATTETTASETPAETTAQETPGFGAFTDWTPSTSVLETDRISVGYTGMAAVREHSDELPVETVAILRRFVNTHVRRFGLDAQSVDHDLQVSPSYEVDDVVESPPIRVAAGGFDVETVVDSTASSGTDPDETYRGFDLYTGGGATVAVGDEVAMRAPDAQLPGSEYLKAAIDARTGAAETLVEASGDAELAMGGLGSVDFIQARTDPYAEADPPSYFEGAVAFARGFTFEGETTRLDWRLVFDRADRIDLEAIRSGVAEDQAGLSTYDYEYEVDGRVAALTGTTPTAQFDLLSEGTP